MAILHISDLESTTSYVFNMSDYGIISSKVLLGLFASQASVNGLHSSVEYDIVFSPLATLADSVTITGSTFERRGISWGEIPGGVQRCKRMT